MAGAHDDLASSGGLKDGEHWPRSAPAHTSPPGWRGVPERAGRSNAGQVHGTEHPRARHICVRSKLSIAGIHVGHWQALGATPPGA